MNGNEPVPIPEPPLELTVKTLRALLIEQTSPVEVVLFLAVTVAFCMAMAAVVYASVLVVLWAVRLRASLSLRRLFLPTGNQFREFAGEYLLALTTALLLTGSLIAKHDLVEDIRNYQIKDLSSPAVARLFPLEEPPKELQELARASAVSVHALLQPVLDVGRAEEAKLYLRALITDRREKTLLAHLTRGRLVTAAVVLGLLYLFWLGFRRVTELRAVPEGKGAPAYGKAVAGLLILALCIALLLATPRLLADPESLAEGTLAAIRHQKVPDRDREFKTQAEVLLREQIALFPSLWLLKTAKDSRPENVIDLITEVRRMAQNVSDRLDLLSDREEESSRRNREQFEDLREQLRELGNQFTSLEESLRQVSEDVLARLEEEGRVRRESFNALTARVNALEGLDSRLEETAERLRLLDTRHQDDIQELRRLVEQMMAELDELSDLEERLATLERQRPTTGTLIVFVHPSRFEEELSLTGPTVRRSFSGGAVFSDLPPGTYRVVGEQIRIEAGAVQGLTVEARPVEERPPPIID